MDRRERTKESGLLLAVMGRQHSRSTEANKEGGTGLPSNIDTFLEDFSAALRDEHGGIFVGAGVSMAAGYPSWSKLLADIGKELGVSSSDVHDLAALAQWHIQHSGNATRVRNVIKAEIARDLEVPETLRIIARLPVRTLWTTNYDKLVERAFAAISRPLDPVSGAADLSLRAKPGAARLFKMHGSVERLDDIVISTDDYELYRSRRGAFLPLLQAHLTSMSMLFVGLSLTDPNVRHVLASIRESFTDAPPEHFALLRPPQRADFESDEEHSARLSQHQLWAKDLRRYGLLALEVEDFDEIPDVLHRLERRVAMRRVWISGSWPIDGADTRAAKAYEVAHTLGREIGNSGDSLVTGGGLLVGSAAISGFLDALRGSAAWDLERRLIARPFPQPLAGKEPDQAQWTELRKELARLSGTVIFVGGVKRENGTLVPAAGVREEYDLARSAGAFLLPIGATGGMAASIAQDLLGSALPFEGKSAIRPTDDALKALNDDSATTTQLVEVASKILKRAPN
jgi:Sir2- and TIR-associating SLOG family/SIR2-like domain